MESGATLKLRSAGTRWEVTLIPEKGKPFLLSESVLDQLDSCFQEIGTSASSGEKEDLTEESPRIVVLRSQDPKYFCVGADIRILKKLKRETIGRWVSRGHEVMNLIEDCPLPIVAKVQGYALGGGLELAMACDLIYADSTAVLGQTEAKIGMVPGWGGTLRLFERVGRSRAKRLTMTGEMLDAESAKAMGLLDYCGPTSSLDTSISDLEKRIVKNGHAAISAYKKILTDARIEARKRCLESEITRSIECIKNTDTLARIDAFVRPKSKSA